VLDQRAEDEDGDDSKSLSKTKQCGQKLEMCHGRAVLNITRHVIS